MMLVHINIKYNCVTLSTSNIFVTRGYDYVHHQTLTNYCIKLFVESIKSHRNYFIVINAYVNIATKVHCCLLVVKNGQR